MQAEYWALAIVGIPIGILLFFYIFAKAVKMGKSAKKPGMAPTNKENVFVGIYAKLKLKLGGKIKRPNWSISWHVIALLIIFSINYGYGYLNTNTYFFTNMTTKDIPNYLQINSGSPRVENSCLIMSQGDRVTIKGSENFDASEVVLVPCDDSAELLDTHIITGSLDAYGYIGERPDGKEKGVKFRVGVIRDTSAKPPNRNSEIVSSFYPTTGNLYASNTILKPLVFQRGSIGWPFLPNNKLWAGTGFTDAITLAQADESIEKGKGKISVEVNKQGIKIKEIVVREGLQVKVLQSISWMWK